jgi:hypothetical protein
LIIPIAKAKTNKSPFGIALTKFLLFNKFHKVSKNLGIINNAISDLLDSGSKNKENPKFIYNILKLIILI